MMSHFFMFSLPLWAYLLLLAGPTFGVGWFAWLFRKERNAKEQAERELQITQEGLQSIDQDLLSIQESLKEIDHDYSTLGLMTEDHHNSILDLEQRLSRLEQRSTHIHIGISKLFQVCQDEDDDDSYVGPEEEDSDAPTLPQPLADWLDCAEGLDTL